MSGFGEVHTGINSSNVTLKYGAGGSRNITDSIVPENHHIITNVLQQYTIPLICGFGLVANTLSSIVFLQKSLRSSSCSIFLATRGISDNGFLSTLIIIWISQTFELKLGEQHGVCQLINFLSYVCGCVSVWLVVFVTLENYIRICRPFIVNRVCKTATAKVAILILYIVVLCIYNFPFWAMNPDCSPNMKHIHTIQGLIYTDTLLTLVIPTMFVAVLMVGIIYNLIKSYNRRGRLNAPTVKRVKNPMAKVTKMLLAVTVSFFCLNLPSHVIRIRLMISSFLKGHNAVSPLDAAIQNIALQVYYISLSMNLIVYYIFGSKFRKVFKSLFYFMSKSDTHKPPEISGFDKECMLPKLEKTGAEKHLVAKCDSADNVHSEIENCR